MTVKRVPDCRRSHRPALIIIIIIKLRCRQEVVEIAAQCLNTSNGDRSQKKSKKKHVLIETRGSVVSGLDPVGRGVAEGAEFGPRAACLTPLVEKCDVGRCGSV